MRETRVLEETQANGTSVFYPQYLGRFGGWKYYTTFCTYSGNHENVGYKSLPEAQEFLDVNRFKSQKRVHPPASNPQPNPRPKPTPRDSSATSRAVREGQTRVPDIPEFLQARDNAGRQCGECGEIVFLAIPFSPNPHEPADRWICEPCYRKAKGLPAKPAPGGSDDHPLPPPHPWPRPVSPGGM